MNGGVLGYEGEGRREYADDEKLYAGHDDGVGAALDETVDEDDVYCENYRTAQHHEVAPPDGEAFLYRKEPESSQRRKCAYPYLFARPLTQHKLEYRHYYNVKRGDEARFSRGGVLYRVLLYRACRKQHDSAAKPAEKRSFKVAVVAFAAYHRDDGQQTQPTDDGAQSVEGKGLHVVEPHALRYKGRAPDYGCEQKQQRTLKFVRQEISTFPYRIRPHPPAPTLSAASAAR